MWPDTYYSKYSSISADGYPVRHRLKDLSGLAIVLEKEYRKKIDSIRKMDVTLDSFILPSDDYLHLVSDAHSSNIHWTTKIEGNELPLEEIEALSELVNTSEERIIYLSPGPTQEIINHLYSYFLHDRFKLPWTVETVTSLHRFLMRSTGERCEPGEIRTDEVSVYSEDGIETFRACPGIHIKKELNDLLEWIDESAYDPMITAIVFFHEFESIHPFTEGNGRVGRSLLHILMQEFGLRNFNLCILEKKLVGNAPIYYSLMEYTDQTGDYTVITQFFIDCIHSAYEEAVDRFSKKDVLRDLDDISRKITLNARSLNDWFDIRTVSEWSPSISDQTIRSRLNTLIRIGVIEKEGNTRATRFRFNDPFRQIRDLLSVEYLR